MSILKINKSKDKRGVTLSWAEEIELNEYANFLTKAEKAILENENCVIDLSGFSLIDVPQLQVLHALKGVFNKKEIQGTFNIKVDESMLPIIEKIGFKDLLNN